MKNQIAIIKRVGRMFKFKNEAQFYKFTSWGFFILLIMVALLLYLQKQAFFRLCDLSCDRIYGMKGTSDSGFNCRCVGEKKSQNITIDFNRSTNLSDVDYDFRRWGLDD